MGESLCAQERKGEVSRDGERRERSREGSGRTATMSFKSPKMSVGTGPEATRVTLRVRERAHQSATMEESKETTHSIPLFPCTDSRCKALASPRSACLLVT